MRECLPYFVLGVVFLGIASCVYINPLPDPEKWRRDLCIIQYKDISEELPKYSNRVGCMMKLNGKWFPATQLRVSPSG